MQSLLHSSLLGGKENGHVTTWPVYMFGRFCLHSHELGVWVEVAPCNLFSIGSKKALWPFVASRENVSWRSEGGDQISSLKDCTCLPRWRAQYIYLSALSTLVNTFCDTELQLQVNIIYNWIRRSFFNYWNLMYLNNYCFFPFISFLFYVCLCFKTVKSSWTRLKFYCFGMRPPMHTKCTFEESSFVLVWLYYYI